MEKSIEEELSQLKVGEHLERLQIDMANPVQAKALCEIVNHFQVKEIEAVITKGEKSGGEMWYAEEVSTYLKERLDFLKSKKF